MHESWRVRMDPAYVIMATEAAMRTLSVPSSVPPMFPIVVRRRPPGAMFFDVYETPELLRINAGSAMIDMSRKVWAKN